MTRSMWNGDPLLLAGGAVVAAALLVMLGTQPALPTEELQHPVLPSAPAERAAAIGGPVYLCRLPAPPAPPVVAWQQGHEIVVAAARLDDTLPEALHARAPTGVWHVPLQPWLGFVPEGPHTRLRLPGLALDCEPTRDD